MTDPGFAGRDYLYMDAIREDPFGGRPGWAVRDHAYKLIEYDDGGRELYDVRTDLAEANDLIANGIPADLRDEVHALDAYGRKVRSSAR